MYTLKKLTIPLILIIFVVSALAAEIEISLIFYNADTNEARIRIANIGSKNLHDITLIIDEEEQKFTGSLLKPETAIQIPRTVLPGTHTVTVKTSEGVTVEKELLFPKTQEQVQKELEEKRAKEEPEEVEEKKETEEVITQITKKTSYTKSIIFLIIFIAVIVALIFMMRFLKKRKNV